jgi:hypothetical protein
MPGIDKEIDKITLQQNNYQWLLSSVASADSKAGFLIVINLAIIGFYFEKWNVYLKSSCIVSLIALFDIASALILISSFFAVKAVFPRFSKNKKSIFYHNAICAIDAESYDKKVAALDEAGILEDLNSQVWILSRIVIKKCKDVKIGMLLTGCSLILFIVFYFGF